MRDVALGRHLTLLLLFAVYFALFVGLGQISGQANWALNDQNKYHLPQINDFIANGIRLDYRATSATTPGAHLIYAIVARSGGRDLLAPDDILINIVSAMIAAITVVLLAWYVLSRTRSVLWAVILTFPVTTSSYFVLSAIYAVTEGASYLFYTLAMIIGLCLPSSALGGLLFSIWMGGLVLARQIFLPVSISYAVSFIVGGHWRGHLLTFSLVLLVGLIPGLVFLPFYLHWQALVPPFFDFHRAPGLNFDLLHHNFVLFGIFSMPYLVIVRHHAKDIAVAVKIGVASLAITLAYMAILEVTYDADAGRWGSAVWQISRLNDLFLPLPMVNTGFMWLGLFVFLMGTWRNFAAGRPILASVMFLTYTVAQFSQTLSWQRYIEFFVLVTLISFTVYEKPAPRWRLVVFFLAFLAYGTLSVISKV